MSNLTPGASRLTPQQQAVIDLAARQPQQAIVVDAKAGSGKTHTIVQMLPALTGENLLLAFNKSIQRELSTRIPAALQFSNSVSTVHSFGLGVLRRNGLKPKIDGGKVNFLFRNILQSKPSFRSLFSEHLAGTATIAKAVGAAKNAGFGLRGFPAIDDAQAWDDLLEHFGLDDDLLDNNISIQNGVEMAQFLLLASNRAESSVDFDDMIYLPLLLGHKIPQHSNVIIDEAQDISATRYELAARACAEHGRMIAVGDPHQAIYGFTGADAASLPNIIRKQSATVLPLSICFRCDAAIIQAAQAYVPGIEARPDAGPGLVDELDITDFLDGPPPTLGSAVLCRLNRPNVAVALHLLRSNIPVKIEGRDLGRTLLDHIKKAEPLYATVSGFELLASLEDYRERRTDELLSRNKAAAAQLFQDEIDGSILLVEKIAENSSPLSTWTQVEALVGTLFADDIPPKGLVTLSSVHKAKGREWPRVYILGRYDYMPFWMASKPWEVEQEGNLIYVATTRAEHHLTHITNVKDWLDNR